MLRRAGKTAAGLALATAVLPCALLAGQEVAAASTTAAASTVAATAAVATSTSASQPTSPITVSITSMSSLWATRGQTITVRGSLTNSSGKQVRNPAVDLLSSPTPIPTVSALQEFSSSGLINGFSPNFYSEGATWQDSAPLQARSSVSWRIVLRVNKIGITGFGVYPLVARAWDATGSAILADDYSFLPYEPAKHGSGARSRVTGRQIAWAWPLIDKPMLGAPWQNGCSGPQAKALAASLSPGGRLDNLLGAGNAGKAKTSLASQDRVTWFIDPALLANVQAMQSCRSYPAGAKAATGWLAGLKKAIKGQPLSVTPYADVNVAALEKAGDGCDVIEAFRLGWGVADSVLRLKLGSPASTGCRASGNSVTGLTWPAGGTGATTAASYDTLENLHSNGISTVLSEGGAAQLTESVVRVPADVGDITVLLANPALSQALSKATTAGSAGTAPFASTQLFLAETAELAAAGPHAPIIVAPTQRWDPSASLTTSFLKETRDAPWLTPVSLNTAAAAKHVPTVSPAAVRTAPQAAYSNPRLGQFSSVDGQIKYLQSFQQFPNQNLWRAAATLESSAWSSPGGARAEATDYNAVLTYLGKQSGARVEIVAKPRVTLGGLKATVPISIYNKLGFPVRVRLLADPGSGGLQVSQVAGLIDVPAGKQYLVKLHVLAAQVGTSVVTLRLLRANGKALANSRPVMMSVRATQLGVLAMIILAVALGLFLLASAARAVHRSRVTGHGDDSSSAEGSGSDAGSHTDEADNVSGERTELGAAGKSGL
jgi:hypothetical protein